MLNFGVSRASISCKSAQTVTELSGNWANLVRQIREMSPNRRYTISNTAKMLQ